MKTNLPMKPASAHLPRREQPAERNNGSPQRGEFPGQHGPLRGALAMRVRGHCVSAPRSCVRLVVKGIISAKLWGPSAVYLLCWPPTSTALALPSCPAPGSDGRAASFEHPTYSHTHLWTTPSPRWAPKSPQKPQGTYLSRWLPFVIWHYNHDEL